MDEEDERHLQAGRVDSEQCDAVPIVEQIDCESKIGQE